MLVLSQTIQFLSLEPVAVTIGLDQVVPPLVERLVTTSTAPDRMPSDEISQTLCLASKATEASLACPYRPPVLVVSPGSEPWVQVAPPSFEVAQPVVRPNGTVLVPFLSSGGQIRSFRSIDGGTSWRSTVLVSTVSHHNAAGGLREEALPSAEIDGAGTAYVAWSDCRFRSGCPANDVVLSKSTSETTWGPVARVPIDAASSAADYFVPGVGVDKNSSAGTARVGITYYFYPNRSCTASTCVLNVGFISSTNGGTSWSTASQVAGSMNLTWLPNTSQGRMFGDYISTSVRPGGNAFPVIPIGFAPSGTTFNLAMYTPTGGLPLSGGARRATEAPSAGVEAFAPPAVPQTAR